MQISPRPHSALFDIFHKETNVYITRRNKKIDEEKKTKNKYTKIVLDSRRNQS